MNRPRRTVRVRPGGPAWFPESSSDGGAHYGELLTNDRVQAVCGAVFTPLAHPQRDGPVWWRQPVDAEHACRACRGPR